MYLMGAYDYYHTRLRGYLTRRRTGSDWVRFLRWARPKYPFGGRSCHFQDNLSVPHDSGGGGGGPKAEDHFRSEPHQRQSPQPDRDPLPNDPSIGLHPDKLHRLGGGRPDRARFDPGAQPRPLRDQLTTRTPLVDTARAGPG